jgi:hypothetical protein
MSQSNLPVIFYRTGKAKEFAGKNAGNIYDTISEI